MERITTRLGGGKFSIAGYDGADLDAMSSAEIAALIDKLTTDLGQLENEIEDGHYLKLPVPLGQKVYEKDGSEWVMQPLYTAVGIGRDAGRLSTFADAAIGDTVFLTKDYGKEN